MIARLGLALLAALVLAAPAAAGDWVTYQGDPGRSGTSDDPSLRPPFAVRWRAPVPLGQDQGFMPPLVAEGRVFVGMRHGGQGTQVAAFDAATGALLWRGDTVNGTGDGELAYESGRIVIVDDSELLTALSATTGEVVWQVDAPGSNRLGLITPGGGNGLVYTSYGPGASLVEAWDVTNGALRWKQQVAGGNGSGAVAVAGGRVVVDTFCGAMSALDANTGAPAWQVPCTSQPHGGELTQVRGDRVYGRGGPTFVRALGNGQDVTNFPGAGPGAFANRRMFTVDGQTLEARAVDDLHILWTFSDGDRIGTLLALGDDAVLVSHKTGLDALDGATGRSLWHEPTIPWGIGAGDGLLFAELGSELVAYAPTPATPAPQRTPTVTATPAIRAARAIARAKLVRPGLAVSVRGAAPGAVVRVTLRRGGRLLAKARGRASAQGLARLRLRTRAARPGVRLRLAVAVGTVKSVRTVAVRR
jgi:eukaryotic-like serine/threonine-protein kinase